MPVERADLGSRAALRRDEEQRLLKIEPLYCLPDRIGSGGVEDAQIEPARLFSEDANEDVRAQGGPAHAEQHAVLEPLRCLLGEGGHGRSLLAHLPHHVEPPEPVLRHLLVLGIVAPQLRILRPQALRHLLLLGEAYAFLGGVALLAEALVELQGPAAFLRERPARNGAQELIERLAEEIESFVGELLANLLDVDAGLAELRELRPRLVGTPV